MYTWIAGPSSRSFIIDKYFIFGRGVLGLGGSSPPLPSPPPPSSSEARSSPPSASVATASYRALRCQLSGLRSYLPVSSAHQPTASRSSGMQMIVATSPITAQPTATTHGSRYGKSTHSSASPAGTLCPQLPSAPKTPGKVSAGKLNSPPMLGPIIVAMPQLRAPSP